MPSTLEFEESVSRREPFVTRTSKGRAEAEGMISTLDSALQWKVSQWSDTSYLRRTVGDEYVVVENLSLMGLKREVTLGSAVVRIRAKRLSRRF